MPHLFVSYSRKDAKITDQLIAALEAAGYSAWVDREDLHAGDQWRAQIVKAIGECQAFIVVLSEQSIQSDNVRRELDIASEMHRPIIPVRLDDIELTGGLLYQLVGIQHITYSGDPQATAQAILQTLQPAHPAVGQVKSPTRLPRPRLWGRSLYLEIGLLLAVSVVGFFTYLYLSGLAKSANRPTATRASVLMDTPRRPTSTERNLSYDCRILAKRQMVFKGPGQAYDPLVQLKQDDQVTAVGKSWGAVAGDWMQILLPEGGTGWIEYVPQRVQLSFKYESLNDANIVGLATPRPPRRLDLVLVNKLQLNDLHTLGVAWDGTSLWFIDRSTKGVLYQMTTTGEIKDKWNLAGLYVDGLTFDGRYVWYTETNISRLFQFDPTAGQVKQQFTIPGAGNINDLAWDGEYLWAVSFAPYRLYQVSAVTGNEIFSLPGPIPPGYSGDLPDFEGDNKTNLSIAGLAWDGLYLWVTETSTDTLMKIHPYSGVIQEYYPGLPGYPGGLTWDGEYFWLTDYDNSVIYQYGYVTP